MDYQRWKSLLVLGLLLLILPVGVALTYALVYAGEAAHQAQITMAKTGDLVGDANDMVGQARQDEGAIAHRFLDKGGLLDGSADELRQVRDVTRSVRLTADEAGLASIQQRHYWQDELPLLTADFAGTVQELHATVKAAQPVLGGAVALEQESTRLTRDVDTRVNSNEVSATFHGAMRLVNQSADAAEHVNESTADAEAKLHSILHPKWPGKIGHGVKSFFHHRRSE